MKPRLIKYPPLTPAHKRAMQERRALLTTLEMDIHKRYTLDTLPSHRHSGGGNSLYHESRDLLRLVKARVELDELLEKLAGRRVDLSTYERALFSFSPLAAKARKHTCESTYGDLKRMAEAQLDKWKSV